MTLRSKIFGLAIAGVCVTAISSCTKMLDNLSAYNKNENQPYKASSATLLTASEFGGVMLDEGSFISSGPSLNNDGDGFLGIFSGHFAGNHAQGLDYNQYVLQHSTQQFLFADAYSNSLQNLKQLIANLRSDETVAYVGIAKILQAYQLGFLTSLYGDIPWSQALTKEHLYPVYDKQDDVYKAVQDLLTDGIRLVKEGGNVSGDIIYDGDLDKWVSLGYLLKARFYNHYSKKDPQGSAVSALLMVDSARKAGFDANMDAGDFKLSYAGVPATASPWYTESSNGMVVANQVFLDSLIAQDDPRLNAFFSSTSGVTGDDVYGLGKVISGTPGTGDYMGIGPDDFNYFGRQEAATVMATYPELLMIEAEAALRSGDKGRAATAHNAAVAAHISEMLSLPASLAADKARVPAYIARFGSETAGSITLEKVMTEKHKIMFAIETECWMDVRRMDYAYPKWLTIPVYDETVSNPVPVASSFIQRLLYPQLELDRNKENVPEATAFDKLPILK